MKVENYEDRPAARKTPPVTARDGAPEPDAPARLERVIAEITETVRRHPLLVGGVVAFALGFVAATLLVRRGSGGGRA
jgi:hypothetical protein